MNKPLMEHPKLLLDPYGTWAAKEAVPVIEDFGVDLLEVATAPWPRFGVEGAIVNLKGRGDFVSIFVLDLAPGAKTAPQRHLYEEVVYVLSGFGSTSVETSDGRTHSFEWGPKSLFALPLNARYQHFNTSGKERARLASTNNLAQMPVGTYKKAHRHGPDFHVYAVTGHGYSLAWYDIAKDMVRVDWRHGVVF